MSSIAKPAVVAQPEATRSQPLIGKGMVVVFIALICCFTAWGIAQDLTTPMVAGFKRIFDMSTFQASSSRRVFRRVLPAGTPSGLHQSAVWL